MNEETHEAFAGRRRTLHARQEDNKNNIAEEDFPFKVVAGLLAAHSTPKSHSLPAMENAMLYFTAELESLLPSLPALLSLLSAYLLHTINNLTHIVYCAFVYWIGLGWLGFWLLGS
jgi:hypothetical protein